MEMKFFPANRDYKLQHYIFFDVLVCYKGVLIAFTGISHYLNKKMKTYERSLTILEMSLTLYNWLSHCRQFHMWRSMQALTRPL